MKPIYAILLPVCFLLFACRYHSDNNLEGKDLSGDSIPYTLFNPADAAEVNKTYMPTGFYYLTENEGVKMIAEHTEKVYNLNRLPFVSVDNISGNRIEEVDMQGDTSSSLIITLDKEGTRSLLEGTGNPTYPYVAVVIGNRLIYVVKNETKVKRGVMNISLLGYTKAQIKEMTDAISQKR